MPDRSRLFRLSEIDRVHIITGIEYTRQILMYLFYKLVSDRFQVDFRLILE